MNYPSKTCVMKKAGGGEVVDRLLYSWGARTGVPLQCPGCRRPPRGVDSWEPYASACSIPAMNQAGLLPTSHSWPFRNNTQHSWLFNNLFGLAQDGSDTPGNQADEPRPIRRSVSRCVQTHSAGTEGKPKINTHTDTPAVPLWGPIKNSTQMKVQERYPPFCAEMSPKEGVSPVRMSKPLTY